MFGSQPGDRPPTIAEMHGATVTHEWRGSVKGKPSFHSLHEASLSYLCLIFTLSSVTAHRYTHASAWFVDRTGTGALGKGHGLRQSHLSSDITHSLTHSSPLCTLGPRHHPTTVSTLLSPWPLSHTPSPVAPAALLLSYLLAPASQCSQLAPLTLLFSPSLSSPSPQSQLSRHQSPVSSRSPLHSYVISIDSSA